jgi:hypothetical protein
MVTAAGDKFENNRIRPVDMPCALRMDFFRPFYQYKSGHVPVKHAESVGDIRTPARCFAIRAADKLVRAGAEGLRSCAPLEIAKK